MTFPCIKTLEEVVEIVLILKDVEDGFLDDFTGLLVGGLLMKLEEFADCLIGGVVVYDIDHFLCDLLSLLLA